MGGRCFRHGFVGAVRIAAKQGVGPGVRSAFLLPMVPNLGKDYFAEETPRARHRPLKNCHGGTTDLQLPHILIRALPLRSTPLFCAGSVALT